MKNVHVLLLLLSAFMVTGYTAADDYQVSITTVNVWIRAIDSAGNPVSGLSKADFDIFEDGKKMTPTCFEEVRLSLDTQPDEKTNVPKRFIVFLDLSNTTQVELDRIRPELIGFLSKVGRNQWQVMLAAYLANGKLGIVSPFSRDIRQINRLLEQAKGNAARDQRITRNERDILELLAPLEVHNQDAPDEPESEGINSESNRGGQLAQIEERYFQMAISNAYRQADVYSQRERQASEHAFAALESFGQYYGEKLSGGEHTVIMFVSGGINSDPGRRYFELVDSYVERTAANVDRQNFTLTNATVVKQNNFDLERLINRSIGKLNRYNLTLYAMNTRGLDSSAADITKMEGKYASLDISLIKDYQDSLANMAEETGGFSFENSQNFRIGFDNVMNDISHQYLICYASPQHKKEGEYHSIKVKTSKPGLRLRHRQGYVD